jgi:hypothetical protein
MSGVGDEKLSETERAVTESNKIPTARTIRFVTIAMPSSDLPTCSPISFWP